jgi:hypothetical protein
MVTSLRPIPVALVLTACAGWTQAHRDNAMSEFRSTTLAKASFSLDCPESQLLVQLVPEGEAMPHNALVSGCGRRATYVRTRAGWLLEGTSAR